MILTPSGTHNSRAYRVQGTRIRCAVIKHIIPKQAVALLGLNCNLNVGKIGGPTLGDIARL